MRSTLVLFVLNIQSSYAENTEVPAIANAFDTVQFFQSEGGCWRIKTYALDQDVHAWFLGDVEDLVALARSNTETHYGDVLAEEHTVRFETGIDGLRRELAERGLGSQLEISEAGFVFWAPQGSQYRTRTSPA